jgi:radical SAM superfamily enzyme YgiQ (UPF0313 family)
MKKVLFIVTPSVSVGEILKKNKSVMSSFMYGALSIITYVNAYKQKDVEFYLLDFNNKKRIHYGYDDILAETKEIISEFNPDIIAIGAFYNYAFESVKTISSFVKSLDNNSLIVCGGACATANYQHMLEEIPALDAVCFSEGEIPMLDLINADDEKHLLMKHPSWIIREKFNEIGQTYPLPSLVENLDDIPPIDYTLINFEDYDRYTSVFSPGIPPNSKVLPLATTRGCPFDCIFCVAGALHGKKMRMMSVERVISDTIELKNKYGMETLYILDDQFLIKKDNAKNILRGLANLNITLMAESGFTVIYIDDETAELLEKAGLKVAKLAVESGSPYVLKNIINKPINLDYVETAVNSFRKYNIFTTAFMVVGLPGETKAHLRESVDYFKKVGFDWVFISCATAFPGSRLYKICKEKGYIPEEDNIENPIYESSITTKDFTAEYITKQAYLINLELNFIHNYRLKNKDYEMARKRFEDIVHKFPDHAFGYYCLVQAYDGLGYDKKIINETKRKFHDIVESNKEWNEYAKHFGLI